jgi:hypothetical protein
VEVVLMGYTDHQQFKTLFTYMSLHGNSADPDNFIASWSNVCRNMRIP